MRYDMPRSGDRSRCDLFGDRAAARQPAPVVPAGMAAGAGADRGGCVSVSMLTGGRSCDESRHLEKSEMSAGDTEQAVSYGMSGKAGTFVSAFFHIWRNTVIW